MKKIIFINLIIIVILLVLLEFCSYLVIRMQDYDYIQEHNKIAKENNEPLLIQRYAPFFYFDQDDFGFRDIQVGKSEKGSIVFFGCSITYGYSETEENTLPYIMNKLTDRTTFNRGIPGGHAFNGLYDLESDKFYEITKNYNKPEYIIYTYINEHPTRMLRPYTSSITTAEEPFYSLTQMYKKDKNGEWKEYKPNKYLMQLYGLYTVRNIYDLYADVLVNNEQKKELMLEVLTQMKKRADEKFPGVKFVILEFKVDENEESLLTGNVLDSLKEQGFIILDAEKMVGHELGSKKWLASDNVHSNGAAFTEMAVGLINELGL